MTAVPLSERLRYALVPGRVRAGFRARRARRWGEPELRLLPRLADGRRAAVDVGANKGVYTYWLARLCPRVYAFEPNPRVRRILQREAAANVVVMPFAASDQSGPAVFRLPLWNGEYPHRLGGLGWQGYDGETFEFTVERRPLDETGLEPVGFIKIDVEGHELEVLRGADKVLRRDRPNLLVEIEEQHMRHQGGGDIGDTFGHLKGLGYTAYMLTEGALHKTEAEAVRDAQRRFHETRQGPYINNFIFLPDSRLV